MQKKDTSRSLNIFVALACFVLFSFSGCSKKQELTSRASQLTTSMPPSQAAPVESDEESDTAKKRLDYLKERFHYGQIDPEVLLQRTREEYERREAEKKIPFSERTSGGGAWISLGPDNEPEPTATSVYGAGRLTAIVPHPSLIGTLHVGSETGGVWKTTDNGNSWNSLTDSLPNLSVMSMAIAPSNQNVIYVGTGAAYVNGIGVLKSVDGGQTWILPTQVISTSGIRCISVHPNSSNELVIGTDLGIHRSTDGGATWTQPLSQKTVFDIARNSANSQIIYAAVAGTTAGLRQVYKSTDGGLSWTERSIGLPLSSASGKLKMAISPSNSQIIYLTMTIQNGSELISHIYKSSDGGDNWIDLPNVYTNSDSLIRGFLGTQSYIHIEITVNPTNPNEVYAGGVFNIRSTDGGQTWVRSFYQCPTNCIHPDQIDMAWQGSTLYMVGDGGVWTTSDGGQTATARNKGLVIRQYYSLFNDPVYPNRIYAGSQDNGTDRRLDSGGVRWKFMFGGDGFDSAVNRNNPERAYVTYQGVEIYRTDNASAQFPNWTRVSPPPFPAGEFRPFSTALTIDPNAPETLYTGSYRIWKTSDGGNSWNPLPTTTIDGSTWSTTTYINSGKVYVAPSNSQILLVAHAGRVFRSSNGGNTWASSVVNGLGCSGYNVDAIAIHPGNSNLVFITTSCFDGGPKVWMSLDGGATWTGRGNGLPPFRNGSIAVDPLDSSTIYCGTEIGVYRTINQGQTWERFGSGLPAITVTDMQLTPGGIKLRIATYGRGVWEYQLRGTRNTLFDFDGDGKADQTVFRPSNNVWYLLRSMYGFTAAQFGASSDKITPADFDGDGRADISVFRAGVWYWLNSSNFSFNAVQFGQAGDIPLPADYSGDGRAELAVYRSGIWYTLNIANNQFQAAQFGLSTDKPVPADFDADGKTDLAIYRGGVWNILRSSQGFTAVQFGNATDRPIVGDYDGDSKADQAVYRSGVWHILGSTQGYYTAEFGIASDIPVAADYDGDGKADIAVFRDGFWYLLRSQQGFTAVQFGTMNDKPIPAAFVP